MTSGGILRAPVSVPHRAASLFPCASFASRPTFVCPRHHSFYASMPISSISFLFFHGDCEYDLSASRWCPCITDRFLVLPVSPAVFRLSSSILMCVFTPSCSAYASLSLYHGCLSVSVLLPFLFGSLSRWRLFQFLSVTPSISTCSLCVYAYDAILGRP